MHGLQTKGRAALILRKQPVLRRVLTVAWLVWLLDAGTKTWAIHSLEGGEPRKVIGTFLQLTFAKNSGAAFSVATGSTMLLTTFALCVIIAIGFWARQITSMPWGYVMGLVLGGALGNLTDRLLRGGSGGAFKGEVIDWLQLPHWPIFNLADSAIVVAALVATVLAFKGVAPIAPQSGNGESAGSDKGRGEGDGDGP